MGGGQRRQLLLQLPLLMLVQLYFPLKRGGMPPDLVDSCHCVSPGREVELFDQRFKDFLVLIVAGQLVLAVVDLDAELQVLLLQCTDGELEGLLCLFCGLRPLGGLLVLRPDLDEAALILHLLVVPLLVDQKLPFLYLCLLIVLQPLPEILTVLLDQLLGQAGLPLNPFPGLAPTDWLLCCGVRRAGNGVSTDGGFQVEGRSGHRGLDFVAHWRPFGSSYELAQQSFGSGDWFGRCAGPRGGPVRPVGDNWLAGAVEAWATRVDVTDVLG
mmetsp:Transcript_6283/g.11161  ORF Transcript_6283/g.11161 Transcript_6283/m.11161 type:complete len:270 (+) Transcript_6283:2545-3354(+)